MEKELRVVGTPQGAEILYVEDYVYSFINTALSEKKNNSMEVILIGDESIENHKHYYYVSGVIFEEEDKRYFKEKKELGRALITYATNKYLQIQIKTAKNDVVDFKDYYIYYADNDNMKNYMLSFASTPSDWGSREEMQSTVNNIPRQADSLRVGEILKYFALVFAMAYIIISMNHYRKLEFVNEQVIYVMKTISEQTTPQEDTFYMP